VSRHGRTPSGRLGRLYLGNSQLAGGNPAAAEGSFRSFLSGGRLDPLSESGARRGLAGALLAQGKPADAAAEYAKSARIEGNPLAADDWLLAAVAHSRAGNRAEAIQSLQTLLEKSPRSQVAMDARVRLKELQAQ
jgi:TolA-binding protein